MYHSGKCTSNLFVFESKLLHQSSSKLHFGLGTAPRHFEFHFGRFMANVTQAHPMARIAFGVPSDDHAEIGRLVRKEHRSKMGILWRGEASASNTQGNASPWGIIRLLGGIRVPTHHCSPNVIFGTKVSRPGDVPCEGLPEIPE